MKNIKESQLFVSLGQVSIYVSLLRLEYKEKHLTLLTLIHFVWFVMFNLLFFFLIPIQFLWHSIYMLNFTVSVGRFVINEKLSFDINHFNASLR